MNGKVVKLKIILSFSIQLNYLVENSHLAPECNIKVSRQWKVVLPLTILLLIVNKKLE